jgi:hypothetical protein
VGKERKREKKEGRKEGRKEGWRGVRIEGKGERGKWVYLFPFSVITTNHNLCGLSNTNVLSSALAQVEAPACQVGDPKFKY